MHFFISTSSHKLTKRSKQRNFTKKYEILQAQLTFKLYNSQKYSFHYPRVKIKQIMHFTILIIQLLLSNTEISIREVKGRRNKVTMPFKV